MKAIAIFALVLSTAGTAAAEQGAFGGVLVDAQSRSIRRLLGGGGAAWATDAAVSGFDFAAAAPDGQNALISKDDTLYIVRRLGGAIPVWRQLPSEIKAVSAAAWSENNETLAVLDAAEPRLEFWTGLGWESKRAGVVDLTGLGERVVSLAVGKDGRYGFAATQGEKSGTLYLLVAGEEPRMLMPLERAGKLLLSGEALYVVDRGRDEVLKITNWERYPSIETVACAGQGVAGPVGVAVSSDRRLLYVANALTQQILAVDLRSSAVKGILDLDFPPTGIDKVGGGALFLLSRGVAGEWGPQMLDAATETVFEVSYGTEGGAE